MNKKQLAHLEKRLLEERDRAVKDIGRYGESFSSTLQSSDGDLSSYSFHMADQGTDAMEREKAFLMASKEGRYLWHVNEALRRLYPARSILHRMQGEGGGGCKALSAVSSGAS
jgi:RNA polymerase-binding transcription factor DksA